MKNAETIEISTLLVAERGGFEYAFSVYSLIL